MEKKQALAILFNAAKLFKKNLEDKKFLVIFKDTTTIDSLELKFSASNFLHLTGVESDFRSSHFYKRCIIQRLTVNDFNFREDGTTELKLEVLERMMDFCKNVKMIGDFNDNSLKLSTEKVAGNVFASIGFVKNNDFFVPNTLLNKDIRHSTNKTKQVLFILSKNMSDEMYKVLEYSAKDNNITDYTFDKKIENMINLHLKQEKE